MKGDGMVWLLAVLFLIILGFFLSGCAGGEQTWRDLSAGATGQLRSTAQLDADAAQCDYEWRAASSGAPVRPYNYHDGVQGSGRAEGEQINRGLTNLGGAFLQGAPVQLYYACMRARGWERLE